MRIVDSISFRINRMRHRSPWQYPNTGRIALCCIAKLENDYIRFYVEYYKNLKFDKIFLYDNNDPDGEHFNDVIGDYMKAGFVDVINYRGRKVAQLSAFQDCYDRHCKDYDWIAFFDVDEFLTFSNGESDIHAFLKQKKFRPYQVMHVNWKVYGDNDMLDTDGRNVVERFTKPVEPLTIQYKGSVCPENNHIKSLIRGGLSDIKWVTSPHTPVNEFYLCCNPEGLPVDVNLPYHDFTYQTLYLRHYSTKTIGEWVRYKMRRGVPDRPEVDSIRAVQLDFFYRCNERTKEKDQYAEKILKEFEQEKSKAVE